MTSPSLPTPENPAYAIAEKALRRWAKERLRQEPGPGGGAVYAFTLSGTTCNNMGLPLETLMIVEVDAAGRITAASSRPGPGDTGCDAMCVCAAKRDAGRFLAESGGGGEAMGLSLSEAAFRDWAVEPSGCFCTEGNRRHKWRNVFQALHYAVTHPASAGPALNTAAKP